MRTLIPLLAIALLTGCATTYHSTRTPAGTDEEFYRAETNCEAKAGQAGYGDSFARRGFMESCMRGEGWTSKSTTPAVDKAKAPGVF